ncbi:hypothetical protein ABOM_003886 [Aspergillus bombycis]|uniref:Cyanovirin-N domain-containing protein n=1 Tax=Aspergillus bombycis TaxID=109264 RepID=A0A1F8A616_9EURO|nr:hypothetical protein ABOM_003886 [Aspergillus bombycis]OGM47133.1 hypothetical protein ABOM_003886 [Aspergillus bombycis]
MGQLMVAGKQFSQHARNITFSFEGPDKLPVHRAELLNNHGNFVSASLMVGNWLFNNDGHFEFQVRNNKYLNVNKFRITAGMPE